MNVEKLTYDKVAEMGVEKVMDESLRAAKKMSEAELETYDTIYDHLDELPLEFFQKSLEELNDHFGGSGEDVTENVRAALFWSKAELAMLDALGDELEDLASAYE